MVAESGDPATTLLTQRHPHGPHSISRRECYHTNPRCTYIILHAYVRLLVVLRTLKRAMPLAVATVLRMCSRMHHYVTRARHLASYLLTPLCARASG